MLARKNSLGRPRRAVVLLAVVVVVVLLSLAGYRYLDWMSAEYRAADSSVKSAQAQALADSGVHYAAAMLAGDVGTTLNNNLFDNTAAFQGMQVPNSVQNSTRRALTGRFSVLSLRSPDDTTGAPYRFGVTDEAGKINLNALIAMEQASSGSGNGPASGPGGTNSGASSASAASTAGASSSGTTASATNSIAKTLLLSLPNMTDDIADDVLNWLDPNPRPAGAGNEYYGSLSPAYSVKKGPLDSLEELLLVRGVTPQLLFGNDRNRNGVLDADEDDGSGQVDPGWAAYLTVYSRENNLDSTGQPRVNLNDQDVQSLQTNLATAINNDDVVNYVMAYRMYGPASTSGRGARGGRATISTADRSKVNTQVSSDRSKSKGGKSGSGGKMTQIKSIFDLVNSSVNVPTGTGKSASTVPYPSPLADSGLARQVLPLLFDKTTTSTQTEVTARINVNTASQAVLTGLETATGLTDSDVQNILSKRPTPSSTAAPDAIFKTPAWLYTEVNLDTNVLKKLEPYVTTRSQVYRFQSVGYFDEGGPTARVEAVIDTNQGRPRIVYYRNLTGMGKAIDLTTSP